jgi:hypothetical protein
MAHRTPPLRKIAIATKAGHADAGPADARGRWHDLLARADALAVAAARRPLRVLVLLLALNAVLIPLFAAAGMVVGDQAFFFREGTPGTVYSFVLLLAITAAARAVYLRDGAAFWRLSTIVFAVFAVDEITQAGMFLSEWLSATFGMGPASGFNDLDSVLLTLLFAGCGLLLASRAAVLFKHPLTLALLVVGGALGVASQALDSFVKPTVWEFVAEETFKLTAEPFFIAAFLVALATVLRRQGEAPPPEPSAC